MKHMANICFELEKIACKFQANISLCSRMVLEGVCSIGWYGCCRLSWRIFHRNRIKCSFMYLNQQVDRFCQMSRFATENEGARWRRFAKFHLTNWGVRTTAHRIHSFPNSCSTHSLLLLNLFHFILALIFSSAIFNRSKSSDILKTLKE